MGACRRVYDLAKAKKLTPILGCEAYFRDDECSILAKVGILGPDVAKYLKYYHVSLHCLDEQAFSFLSQKLSSARLESHGSQSKPLFNWRDLEEILSYNVTVGSSCLVGMTQRHLLEDTFDLPIRYQLASGYYDRLRGMARPGNFLVEVFPHRTTHDWVSGIFLDLANGERLRYWEKKKLRFEKNGEMFAKEAAAKFLTNKWRDADRLVAVMNNRKWADREPTQVLKVEHVRDFLQNECLPWCPDGDMQRSCNRVVLELAKKHNDPVLISDDAHYAHPEDKVVQDVRLRQMGDWRFYGHYNRMSSEDAFSVFKDTLKVDQKTFEGWVDNNIAWGSRFKDFKFEPMLSLPTKFYPQDTLAHTSELIRKHGRMDWSKPEYVNRLRAEINLLHKNGKIDLLPYFFLSEDVCSFYESKGLLTGPGRGSAAGLLLTYLLGVTHVDPIRYGLSLERFITMDRIRSGKLPDIDQDLPLRDPLVDPNDSKKGWLADRFGDHYAQIGVSVKLKLKSSVKDVSRAIRNHVPSDIEELAKKFELPPQGIEDHDFVFGYEDSGADVPGSITYDKALQEYVRRYPDDWAIAQKCLGLQRQRGRHACGFVVANRPISEFIPLEVVGGVPVTQFSPESVEAAGGLKMDFLVVNSLRDLGEAIKLIQQRTLEGLAETEELIRGGSGTPLSFKETTIDGKRVPAHRLIPEPGSMRDLDIWDLPEDQAVFQEIAAGQTETVFQFSTNGAVQWLEQFNHWKDESQGRKAIDSIMSMAIFTALDRPGPLDATVKGPDGHKHNMLVEYARRARGEEPVGEVPLLTELLPETEGVLCFQEGLQRVYQKLTGCPGAEAEEFRSLVAKKKMDKVLKLHDPWMKKVGAAHGEEIAKTVWDQVLTFGQYGFNASHAVCYVHIAYACAYLKHHYPLEWWCAVLRNASKDEIVTTFWKHCGHLVDLPDVSLSGENFEIVNNRIRAPLSILHGVGPMAHQQLVKYRPYANIDDFCTKHEQHAEDGRKPVMDEKTGKQVIVKKRIRGQDVDVPKTKRGRNAVTRGVAYSLILSGVMDSLFPPDKDILDVDKFGMFEAAQARVKGKKRAKPVDPSYWDLTPLTRYQMRKATLPISKEPLMPLIAAADPRVIKRKVGEHTVAMWPRGIGQIAFRPAKTVETLNWVDPIDHPIWVAVPAYVLSQRHFSFQGGKEACELVLDVDGARMKFVKWPSWDSEDGSLDELFKTELKGAVIVACLCKNTGGKPFKLEEIAVVQPPLSKEKEDDDNDPERPEASSDSADAAA